MIRVRVKNILGTSHQSMTVTEDERGIVRIRPVYLGLHHYTSVYGSVCSADVSGTPPFPSLMREEAEESAKEMVQDFRSRVNVDFVEVEEPLVVAGHRDIRAIRRQITLDTDAVIVRSRGAVPLEMQTISNLGLPIARPDENFLRALRARKYLKESKFLYIGEIPSFSAPNGPYDFPLIERRFGVRVRHIETNEFYRHFDRFTDEEVGEELESWRGDFAKIIEPDREQLVNAARVYLALRELCEREDANGITVNCGRFTEERPVVPCMAFNRLIDQGVMCACEGDITAMLASLLLHAISQKAVTMGNFGSRKGTFKAREGEVTIEHDLIPLSLASSRFTVRDYHGRKFGVTAYADIEPGQPMTLLNMDKSLRAISVIEGRIKGTEDGIHCREIVHMTVDGDVEDVPKVIVGSQHVSMTLGHWMNPLIEAGKLLDLEIRRL